jgi:hypothetical protein
LWVHSANGDETESYVCLPPDTGTARGASSSEDGGTSPVLSPSDATACEVLDAGSEDVTVVAKSAAEPTLVDSTPLIAGCGSSSDDPQLLTSTEELCAGASPVYLVNGEEIGVSEECPFVQQTDNITKFGAALHGSSALYDAKGVHVATLTHTCDAWALGTDPDGVAVVVKRATGEFFSHGTLHPGQIKSRIPTPLPLPATLH